MERYNYYEAMKNDVMDALENYEAGEYDRDELESLMYDDLWIDDSVTGNASGSYWFSTWKAEEAIAHNWDLLTEAYNEFGDQEIDLDNFSPESADVTIRCYLLPQIIAQVLDTVENTKPEFFKA